MLKILRTSLTTQALAGMALSFLLVVFVMAGIGSRAVRGAVTEQYVDAAYHTARTARTYLNPDHTDFQIVLNTQIYVDKTELIAHTNQVINTEQRFICVSRPRRFGKSIAANMLTAYYSRGCDSAEMFAPYKIAEDASFQKHLNQYNVIRINMANFMSRGNDMPQILDYLCKRLLHEIS